MSKRLGLLDQLKRSFSSRRRANRSHRSSWSRPRQTRFESLEVRQLLDGMSLLGVTPPVAENDIAATHIGRPITIDILSNDFDPDGSLDTTKVQIVAGGAPAHGSAQVNAVNGKVTYTPVAGYVGTDTFRYTVKDNDGMVSNEAEVTVNITNADPLAVNDTATTYVETAVTIDVVANDSDLDGTLDKTSVAIATGGDPAHGSVAIDPLTGKITYTPTAGYVGEDTFRYTVQDNLGAVSNEATVTVTVNHRPPVAANDFALADAGDAVTIAVLANDSDPDGHALTQIVVTQGSDKGYWHINPDNPGTPNYDATLTFTPNGNYAGNVTLRYKVRDSQGDLSNEATVTITYVNGVDVDLDQAASLNLNSGQYWYHLKTTHEGMMTLQANFDPAGGSVLLSLHDNSFDPNDPDASLLETQNRRMDRPVSAGEDYYLLVTGTNSDVDLVMANIFKNDAGDVTVYGTDSSDGLEVSATKVTIRDVAEGFSVDYDLASITSVTFDAGDGNDEAKILGTSADETIGVSIDEIADKVTVSGLAYAVTLNSVSDTTVVGGGGTDTAVLNGTSSKDTLSNASGKVALSGASYRSSAEDFDTIQVHATPAGGDVANLVDSVGDDTLTAQPGSATLQRSDYTIETDNFLEVYVSAATGGHDIAHLTGSNASDSLTAAPDRVTLATRDWIMEASSFDEVYATAVAGGNDRATFSDRRASDNVNTDVKFTADPTSAKMEPAGGLGFLVEAKLFTFVTATATAGGGDQAALNGSSDNDTLVATPTNAKLTTAPGAILEAAGFASVVVDAAGGAADYAWLYDSTGNDLFAANPDNATLSGTGYSNQAKAFDVVQAFSNAGGQDRAEFNGSDQTDVFVTGPNGSGSTENFSRMLRSGAYQNRATAFEEILVDGKGANDLLQLTDTAGDDALTLKPGEAIFTAENFAVSLKGLERTSGYDHLSFDLGGNTGDEDTVVFYDGTGADQFEATPQQAKMTGPGLKYSAGGYHTAIAYATAGGADSARLYDSAGDDTLNVWATEAELTGDGFALGVAGFEYVRGYSQGGEDKATLYGTSADEALIADPTSSVIRYGLNLSGGAVGFKTVVAHSGGGNDTALLYDSANKDTLTVKPNQVVLTDEDGGAKTYSIEANQFGRVRVYGDTHADADAAILEDSAGNDTLVANPTSATFTGSGLNAYLLGFSEITATASAGGADVAKLSGSSGADEFQGRPDLNYSELIGAGFKFRVNQFEQVTADGAGGSDKLYLRETDGDDTFTFRPSEVGFAGDGLAITAKNFEYTDGAVTIFVKADLHTDDSDLAEFYDGKGNDRFIADPTQAVLEIGGTVVAKALGFGTVRAHATAGGNDTAVLTDTKDNDTLTAAPEGMELKGAGYTLVALGFETTVAESIGGKDTATLEDSSGNDTFIAGPKEATFQFANKFVQKALGFETVAAYASGGDDTVTLLESSGDDTLTAKSDQVDFSGENFDIHAFDFEHLRVYADSTTTDNDTANLYDNAGDNTLVASSEGARFTGGGLDYWMKGFDKLYAFASAGGKDVASLVGTAGNDTLAASPTKATLQGADYFLEVSTFDEVRVDAKTGAADVAELSDSANDDVFTATPTVATLKGSNYSIRAAAFDQVHAFGSGGLDTAKFFDSAGNDTFVGRPDASVMSGAGYYNRAKNFEHVYAYADTPGDGDDSATLYDSAMGDLLKAEGSKAVMTPYSSPIYYMYDVNSFDTVTAVGSFGSNLRSVKAIDYTLNFEGSWLS